MTTHTFSTTLRKWQTRKKKTTSSTSLIEWHISKDYTDTFRRVLPMKKTCLDIGLLTNGFANCTVHLAQAGQVTIVWWRLMAHPNPSHLCEQVCCLEILPEKKGSTPNRQSPTRLPATRPQFSRASPVIPQGLNFVIPSWPKMEETQWNENATLYPQTNNSWQWECAHQTNKSEWPAAWSASFSQIGANLPTQRVFIMGHGSTNWTFWPFVTSGDHPKKSPS